MAGIVFYTEHIAYLQPFDNVPIKVEGCVSNNRTLIVVVVFSVRYVIVIELFIYKFAVFPDFVVKSVCCAVFKIWTEDGLAFEETAAAYGENIVIVQTGIQTDGKMDVLDDFKVVLCGESETVLVVRLYDIVLAVV